MSRERLTHKIAATKDNSKKTIEGRELDGFEYDKNKAKLLKKVLHSINVSLGTLISAMKDVSMIRGSEITPDGKLGGKGFIMSFKDIKRIIGEAVNGLSDVTDTIADELTNPMWGLSTTEKKIVKKEQEKVDTTVEEAESVVEDEVPSSPEVSEEIVEDEGTDTGDKDAKECDDESKEIIEDSDNKYRSLVLSPNDKTASALSRKIIANLLTGENKNG